MATKRFVPKALAKAQVDTVTVANTWAAADTATATINEKDLVLTVGSLVTTAAVATDIKEMLNGDEFTDASAAASETGDNVPEFGGELAATVSGSVVTVTGTEKGRPFTLTFAESTAGSGTATLANVIAATGPNHWDNVDNWGGSSLPADTDTVWVDHSDVAILYGLGQGSIQPAALHVPMTFTAEIGLPEVSADGGYNEYRKTYLEIGPAVLEIGAGPGAGSGRIKINSGTDQCALNLINSGSAAEADVPAVLWKGTHASNSLTMRGGSLGVALFGGEAATLATFVVDGGELTLGSGVTLSGALVVNGGTVRINSLVDGSLTVNGGTVIIDGTGAVDQLTIRGGTVVYNTTGTLGGNTVVSGDGVLDFGQAPGTTQVTNPIDIYGANCRVLDPRGRVWDGATARKVVVDGNEGADPGTQVVWGTNFRLTRVATA